LLADRRAPRAPPVSFGRLTFRPSNGTPTGYVATVCQVTEVVGMSERRGARFPSVRPSVQGWPEPSATGRMPATYGLHPH
jgi:hypothetical protein